VPAGLACRAHLQTRYGVLDGTDLQTTDETAARHGEHDSLMIARKSGRSCVNFTGYPSAICVQVRWHPSIKEFPFFQQNVERNITSSPRMNWTIRGTYFIDGALG